MNLNNLLLKKENVSLVLFAMVWLVYGHIHAIGAVTQIDAARILFIDSPISVFNACASLFGLSSPIPFRSTSMLLFALNAVVLHRIAQSLTEKFNPQIDEETINFFSFFVASAFICFPTQFFVLFPLESGNVFLSQLLISLSFLLFIDWPMGRQGIAKYLVPPLPIIASIPFISLEMVPLFIVSVSSILFLILVKTRIKKKVLALFLLSFIVTNIIAGFSTREKLKKVLEEVTSIQKISSLHSYLKDKGFEKKANQMVHELALRNQLSQKEKELILSGDL